MLSESDSPQALFLSYLGQRGYERVLALTRPRDATEALQHCQFDVVVVLAPTCSDPSMRSISTARAGPHPCGSIVVSRNDEFRFRAVHAAAADFMLESAPAERFDEGLRRGRAQTDMLRRLAVPQARPDKNGVSAGTACLTSLERMERLTAGYRLTQRQLHALSLVARGLNDGELAEQLHITQRGVRRLMEAGFAKIGVRCRRQFLGFVWKGRDAPARRSTPTDPHTLAPGGRPVQVSPRVAHGYGKAIEKRDEKRSF